MGENTFLHTGSLPSTPFFNLKDQEHLHRCVWRCPRLSGVPCNPFVLKKEPSQENDDGFEREISGNTLP